MGGIIVSRLTTKFWSSVAIVDDYVTQAPSSICLVNVPVIARIYQVRRPDLRDHLFYAPSRLQADP